EIAKLLKDNSELKLLVVGHSDNQGDFDYNIDLSKRRAESVKQALVSNYGINAARLKPWGVGYAAPVASNKAEPGRAKNRRVELVKQ
ncbi:MAG: OmpA family protein, partial [Kangiella sp.]|nr:OmpA family protein [Kangiella sp.]